MNTYTLKEISGQLSFSSLTLIIFGLVLSSEFGRTLFYSGLIMAALSVSYLVTAKVQARNAKRFDPQASRERLEARTIDLSPDLTAPDYSALTIDAEGFKAALDSFNAKGGE